MRFLLLQVRNADDPMRHQEVTCFARTLACDPRQFETFDLLNEPLTTESLAGVDLVLLGGSGDYSACSSEPWLMRALESLRLLVDRGMPTFASCWGFQAFARALGGTVRNDRRIAEVGSHQVWLTEEGRRDPIFGALPDPFWAQMGHEDHVIDLPPGAVRLAKGHQVPNQAYRMEGRPIYATQFHPELSASDLGERIRQYPEYLKLTTGMTVDEFLASVRETPDVAAAFRRFVQQVREQGSIVGADTTTR
ncbi:GMP synthase [glutamine-hydrolyzing] [Planctomycetes bacterium Pan216]|uniref:GMP synthase [glutamine-hydrolyzing] n=1 Tax=Kolteria novifilia TaxID=2527975 RepID=A0A518B104_9BACT|nr:GMP synthase [glutamine-hydrolyzing] [Planctomycetes bacterium Pan216]